MNIIDGLRGINNTQAYALLLELEAKSAESDALYPYLGDFFALLDSKSPFERTRGFRLICAQAKWDNENKIEKNFDRLLACLDDEKPTVVRQCLSALRTVLLYKPELCAKTEEKLETLDLSKYKDSMAPLIGKDIEELRAAML